MCALPRTISHSPDDLDRPHSMSISPVTGTCHGHELCNFSPATGHADFCGLNPKNAEKLDLSPMTAAADNVDSPRTVDGTLPDSLPPVSTPEKSRGSGMMSESAFTTPLSRQGSVTPVDIGVASSPIPWELNLASAAIDVESQDQTPPSRDGLSGAVHCDDLASGFKRSHSFLGDVVSNLNKKTKTLVADAFPVDQTTLVGGDLHGGILTIRIPIYLANDDDSQTPDNATKVAAIHIMAELVKQIGDPVAAAIHKHITDLTDDMSDVVSRPKYVMPLLALDCSLAHNFDLNLRVAVTTPTFATTSPP